MGEIGYVRPRSLASQSGLGVVFGCAFKLFMKVIVMPLLGPLKINRLPLPGRKRAALPGRAFTMIVGAGFGKNCIPRLPIHASASFSGPCERREIHRPAHLRVVCPGRSRQPGASRGRTGDDHGDPCLRHDLRNHGPDLDGDVCACCVRSCGGCDYLLEPRSGCRPPRVQMAAMTAKKSNQPPQPTAGRFDANLSK